MGVARCEHVKKAVHMPHDQNPTTLRTDVTELVDQDFGDVLTLNCPCGHTTALSGGGYADRCEACHRAYFVVRSLTVYEIDPNDHSYVFLGDEVTHE